ncbi:hypothetical protein CCMSSC00406_0009090 [Pleurotus cornucopiae]|uniref:Uncharacterized protein n=1 Tax=Pleurotus cornucopiae TaxID=5321 RepID=A0ACB7J808_PLECO|nr:hypothetical protein CCMSSC00406_0009090 [Pleurotus cornucopiae]
MGIVQSIFLAIFPGKPKFSVDEIPDLTGQVIIVTGANTGIGKETVKALLAHNAKVYIAARNEEKTRVAIQDLKAATGKEAYYLHLDLADLKAIKQAAAEFLRGVMTPPIEQTTADDYDLTFGTNALGHFYFTSLLLPTMSATAKETGNPSRVATTCSLGSFFARSIDYETLKGASNPKRLKKGSQYMYAQSKFANLVFAVELARRYSGEGIVSIGVNPGNIQSDLQRHFGTLEHIFIDWMLFPTSMGALTQLYAGTVPEAEKYNGQGQLQMQASERNCGIGWKHKSPMSKGSFLSLLSLSPFSNDTLLPAKAYMRTSTYLDP